MADRMTQEQRHRCMSHIRGSNTKPELLVRGRLFALGFRYRINVKSLPGCPDIVLKRYRTAIFVNGCFWHGHKGCSLSSIPQTHHDFWEAKIERNRHRDEVNLAHLQALGWNTITIWECQLRPDVLDGTIENTAATLRSNLDRFLEEYDRSRRIRQTTRFNDRVRRERTRFIQDQVAEDLTSYRGK